MLKASDVKNDDADSPSPWLTACVHFSSWFDCLLRPVVSLLRLGDGYDCNGQRHDCRRYDRFHVWLLVRSWSRHRRLSRTRRKARTPCRRTRQSTVRDRPRSLRVAATKNCTTQTTGIPER